MSDLAIERGKSGDGVFGLRTVIVLVAMGIAGFVAIALASTYLPNSNATGGATAHALSNGATGYTGIIRLSRATGRDVSVIRDDTLLTRSGLMVLTPPSGATPVGDVIGLRREMPTLMVLPKWSTIPDPKHPGFIGKIGLLPAGEPQGVLAPANKLTVTRDDKSAGAPLTAAGFLPDNIRFTAPASLQTIAGANLNPLIVDSHNRIVLGQIGDKGVYVLADPDLIDNLGMSDAANAQAAVSLLDELNDIGEPIAFDVTLVGLGRPPSPLRLAFDPPFLAMTLTLIAAMLLAGWQAFARFGPVARRERAIAFGKTALVDNSAALIAKARRQTRLGSRYVDVIRDRAVIAFGVPARLRDGAIDAYLDKLSGRARFTELAQAVDAATDKNSLVAAAQALHDWQKEKST